MESYSAETYGERIAAVYDDLYSGYEEIAIHRLAQMAQGGRALEFGIGTGRIALPLQAMGVEVHGIDASPAMIEKLKAKSGGDRIQVLEGDFTTVEAQGKFSLVYIVFNTIFAPLTQEQQLHCFENAARHLTPEGVFVVEAFVPDLKRFSAGQVLRVNSMDNDNLFLDASQVDIPRQLITAQHVHLSAQGVEIFPVRLRYIWPAEMDLMARLAGLRLRHRWGGWEQSAFGAASQRHISLYELDQ